MYGAQDGPTLTRHLLHLLHKCMCRKGVQSGCGLVAEQQRRVRQQLNRTLKTKCNGPVCLKMPYSYTVASPYRKITRCKDASFILFSVYRLA